MLHMSWRPQDDSEVKRLKRKQSNRESARRSRLKKQVRRPITGHIEEVATIQ